MSEALLIVLLVAALLGLVGLAGLWQRERRRADGLEQELARARRDRQSRSATPPPPLQAVLQTAVRVRDEGLGEVLRSSLEDLAGLAEEAEPELRKLAARDDGALTIFFSDIQDSTALNEKAGDRSWLRVLEAHDRIVRRATDRKGGYVVKSQGDGFMIAFASATDAVRASIEVQRALDSPPRSLRGKGVAVRIGLHAGPALEKGGDLFGRNVALAARVADQAEGKQILVTESVCEAAQGEADDVTFTEVGEVELKGFPEAHTLLAVDWRDAD